MEKFSGLHLPDGQPVYTQEYVASLRESKSDRFILAQKGAQERMLAQDVDILICGGSRGGSKGEPYSSPVVTPFGLRRMGNLKVGDIITDINGGMQRVICITELGNVKVYRITFSDGTSVRCTADHLWKIKATNVRTKKRLRYNLGQEADWRLWTTDMIRQLLERQSDGELSTGANKCNLLVPLCQPVRFTRSFNGKAKPQTPAYVMGCLLGDGCITDTVKNGSYDALLCTADDEIAGYFREYGFDMSNFARKQGGRASDYRIKDGTLRADLHNLGLYGCNSHNKFVPEYYLYAPLEVRWDFIQGLMDTDGMADARGHCSFSTVSKRLADGVAFILRSLGAYVTVTVNKAGYRDIDGCYIPCSDVYSLYIKIKDSYRLFRLKRKKDRCRDYNGGVSQPTKRIVSCEFDGYDKCRCIAVSDPSALYLTDDFTVTHNSFSLLLEGLKDAQKANFNALLLRKETGDLAGLVNDSYRVYSQYGEYHSSKDDTTWHFRNGGKLKFSYYDGSYLDFKERFQGRQYNFIGIDEITQCPYEKFKYLSTCNRNAHGLRNRIWGTCNPDPRSWVRLFIDWWIDADGYIDPARDGVIRYCYMDGDDVNNVVWGDTRHEVFEMCQEKIMRLWKPEYDDMGLDPEHTFIQSVTFVRADLSDNKKLLLSDPAYLARLGQQDEEQVMRDLLANWNFITGGDDLVSAQDLDAIFDNSYQLGDGIRRCTADIALEGGDNLVMWLWVGWHVQDFFCCRVDSATAVSCIKAKLKEWGVHETNFCYDKQGIGQYIKGFFPDALPFVNQAAPVANDADEQKGIKYMYKDLKSQCAWLFKETIRDKAMSFEKSLLNLKVSGNGYKSVPLRQILQKERKSLRRDSEDTDRGFRLMPKKNAIKIVGHSPDFWEALLFREYFELEKPYKQPENFWLVTGSRSIPQGFIQPGQPSFRPPRYRPY